MNKNLAVRMQSGKYVIITLDHIPRHTLLMISKAVVYEKKGSKKSVTNTVAKSMLMQKSFQRTINEILRWTRNQAE